MAEPFIAEVRLFPYNFAPRGWAFCQGQLLPISQNTALFSLIGTTYGGDGRSTMALPDLRSRFAMHPGRGPGLTDRRLGERVGTSSVTLSEAQMPNHRHEVRTAVSPTTPGPSGAMPAQSLGGRAYRAPGTTTTTMASAVMPSGGSVAHENRQPGLALNFCIALQGLYPSRS